MAKKQFWIIIDTETTNDNQVFDFGAIVVDRQGNIHSSCAIIVKDNMEKELFSDPSGKSFWSKSYASQKKNNYMDMLEKGNRMMASVNAINRWLEKVNAKYNPAMTAYNVAFDQSKCANTGIDLTIFNEVMAHFITGRNNHEPHTALEDAQFFELPILLAVLNKRNWKDFTNKPYSWNAYQVKNHFEAK